MKMVRAHVNMIISLEAELLKIKLMFQHSQLVWKLWLEEAGSWPAAHTSIFWQFLLYLQDSSG